CESRFASGGSAPLAASVTSALAESARDMSGLTRTPLDRAQHVDVPYPIGLGAVRQHDSMAKGWHEEGAHVVDVGRSLASQGGARLRCENEGLAPPRPRTVANVVFHLVHDALLALGACRAREADGKAHGLVGNRNARDQAAEGTHVVDR